MKADPFRQQRLLDLQAIDTRLDQIAHARAHLPQSAQLARATDAAEVARGNLVLAETELGDVQREVSRAETEVKQVRDRAERDRTRLDSGTGTSKELLALQQELESLGRRQATLEDVELEAMERAEAAGAEVDRLRAISDEASAKVERLTAERDAAVVELDAEATEVAAGRPAVVEAVGPELTALFDTIRAAQGGIGAAELKGRRCMGCQLELNAGELGRIANTPADVVVRCEECERILVRIPGSDGQA